MKKIIKYFFSIFFKYLPADMVYHIVINKMRFLRYVDPHLVQENGLIH